MIALKSNFVIYFTLIITDAFCNSLRRPVREFDPNKLMENYMKLRTNIELFGSFHPNDLIQAIHAFENHEQDNTALEKSKQQLTGKGFNPNGQSMFAGSPLSNWGFTYYNPNKAIDQYLGQNLGTGSLGTDSSGGKQSASSIKTPDVQQQGLPNMDSGSFNADKLNDQLMSSFQDNPFGSVFQEKGFSSSTSVNQKTDSGFNPDELNDKLMSILQKEKPMKEVHQDLNFGMDKIEKENNTENNFNTFSKFDFQTFGKSAFNPDTLNKKLIGSFGYDATAINKQTSHPVFSLSAFQKTPNSTAYGLSMGLMGSHLSHDKSNTIKGDKISTSNEIDQAIGAISDNKNNRTQSGYHAVHHAAKVSHVQQHIQPTSSTHANVVTNINMDGKNINQAQTNGKLHHSGETNSGYAHATGIGGLGISINNGNEVTQTGNAYTSNFQGNGDVITGKMSVESYSNSGNNSTILSQAGVSNEHSVHATGIGSLGIGMEVPKAFEGHATGIGSLGVSGMNKQQGLPGINQGGLGSEVTQTGSKNVDEVQATGIGTLGTVSQQSGTGTQYALSGLGQSSQKFAVTQTGAQNTGKVQATGIGGLGEGSQPGGMNTDNGSKTLLQTIENNVNNALATGIGGLGGKEGSSGTKYGGNSQSAGNVIGIGGLGGQSHFGNFGEIDKLKPTK